MKRFLSLSAVAFALAACVDTTGLSSNLNNVVHPRSNPNAAVVVQEYADLQCPACKAAHAQIVGSMLQQYGSMIRYEFHHMPLVSLHRYAMEAAEAAECAGDQGKFWEFVDHDYKNQEQLNSAALKDWAAELGLDTELFNRCLDSGIKRNAVQAAYNEGRAMGVTGTPTFFVNGERVESTLPAIGAAIEQAEGNAAKNL